MRRILVALALLLGTAASSAAQFRGPIVLAPTSQVGRLVSSLPATCTVGEVVFKTSSPIGLHQCSATNTWTQVGAGPAWGTITGTLSDQTDLQTALNARSPGGAANSIQYNNASAFGGFGTWTAASRMFTVGGNIALSSDADAGGEYTLAKSGFVFVDGNGAEIFRVRGGDPDVNNYNSWNLYVGLLAGAAQPSDNSSAGYYNTGIGAMALNAITEGTDNTAVGQGALVALTTSYDMTVMGSDAGASVTSGAQGSVIIGRRAGMSNTTGDFNTFVGTNAGRYFTTGSNNVAIGLGAGLPFSPPDATLSNTIAIGSLATVAASNTAVIGDSSVTDVYFGSTSAAATIHVADCVGCAAAVNVGVTVDGGGSTITTGIKGSITVPFTGTITGWTVLSTDATPTAGAVAFDIWKDTYANYPPTVDDTIIPSGTKPNITATNTKGQFANLTGWTTSVTAGDVLLFNVDSVTSLTRVTLILTIQPS